MGSAGVVHCTPKVEDKCVWIVDGCCDRQILERRTTAMDCSVVVAYFEEDGITAVAGPITFSKEPPIKTVVCGLPPPPVKAVDTLVCDGTVTAGGAEVEQTVQTVPHPDHVQRVLICGPSQDREMQVLCVKSTGQKVVIQNVTPVDAPLGTPPIFEAWQLDGTAFTGNINTLIDCGAERVDVVTEDYCAANVNYTRVSFFDVEATPQVLLGTLWMNATGAVVAAPPGAVKGVCRQIEVEFEATAEVGCANGVPYTRVTRELREVENGTLVSLAQFWRDSAGAEVTTAPAGWRLGECAPLDIEVDTEPGCANGVPWTRFVRTTYDPNAAGAATSITLYYRASDGSQQTAQPAGWTLGACPALAPADLAIESGGGNYASGTFTATHDPFGLGSAINLSSFPRLQSFTVVVLQGASMATDFVEIGFATGGTKLRLLKGQSHTWSVAQHANANEVLREAEITANGNAAFTIAYTYQV
jgi:hypothetical protein